MADGVDLDYAPKLVDVVDIVIRQANHKCAASGFTPYQSVTFKQSQRLSNRNTTYRELICQ